MCCLQSSPSSLKRFALICMQVLCILQAPTLSQGANILGLFTTHSPSHLIVHMSIVKALAERGHNVTVVCSQQPKVTYDRIKVIVIPPQEDQEQEMREQLSLMASRKNTMMTTAMSLLGSMRLLIDMQFELLQDQRFKAFSENPDTQFDLVVMGYFLNDYHLGVAAKFRCPVIISWLNSPVEFINAFIGNPDEIAYVPSMNMASKSGEYMGFMGRVQNMATSIFFRLFGIITDYKMEKFYNQLFSNESAHFPSYYQVKKNVSLIFCNSHFSEGPIRPNVPAIIEIGGIQIKDTPDQLPNDIAEFLNASANNGAILFSLGSNLQSSNIKAEIMATVFSVLSNLPQNVIWKWEDLNRTPGNSPNILYKKWLPQDDILAHPNLKLFITHAGKGSLAEAQYHGVPMVALPVFADQPSNAEKIVASGYGLQLDLLNITETNLNHAIKEVISNPMYARNLRQFSQLYRDRPLTAKQSVVYWTEYVLRYHGAPHMQSPRVHLNFIQSANLDVIAFVFLIAYIFWKLTKLILKVAYRKFRKNNKDIKVKKVKKQ